MRAAVVAVAGAVAAGLLALAALLAVAAPGAGGWWLEVLLAAVGLLALGIVAWKVGQPPNAAPEPVRPWADEGTPLPPERAPGDDLVSGQYLAGVVELASDRARNEGTVADGIDVVRPELRPVLVDVLVRGGASRAEAERLVADGTWTDDDVAAAVFDEGVTPPDRPLRDRVRAWLFPERVVRDRVRRAVGELAATADDQLPTVVGQDAPRQTPVARPTLSDLQRTVDGTLQPAGTRPDGTPSPDAEDPTEVRPPDERDEIGGETDRASAGRADASGGRSAGAGQWSDVGGVDE